MKPPQEFDADVAELTETLLGSFREDVAPSHARKATLAMLGLAGATTATASTISVSAGAASALSGMAKVSVLVVAKALAGGALVGAVVVGTSSYLQTRAAHETRGTSSVAARPVAPPRDRVEAAIPPPAPNPAGEPPASTSSPSVAPRQDTNAVVARAAPPPAPPPPPLGETSALAPVPTEVAAPGHDAAVAMPISSLAREIALLDESRAALARGDASGALRVLDRYAADFRQGALGPEATVLRIEALVLRGEPRAAREVADAFERAHPTDSHLARIRSLLAKVPR